MKFAKALTSSRIVYGLLTICDSRRRFATCHTTCDLEIRQNIQQPGSAATFPYKNWVMIPKRIATPKEQPTYILRRHVLRKRRR